MQRVLLATLILAGCGTAVAPSVDAVDMGAAPEPDAAASLELDAGGEVDAAVLDEEEPEPEPEAPQHPMAPPELPEYSAGECPVLVGGPDNDSALVEAFPSGDTMRSFRLVVPEHYDASKRWPVVFAWHWLNASSSSFVRQGELATATRDMDFIAVVPDGLRRDDGEKAFFFTWPFAEDWGMEGEVVFFEDMLACVGQQFNVDRGRIYGIGVSAGGLWVSYLSTTVMAKYFAAIESLSGGLGELFGVWSLEHVVQPRRFPALVLWGGPNDWAGLSFEEASIRYRDALLHNGHFVVECVHDAGHGMPPIEPEQQETRFSMLWRFMLDHPYDLPAGTSPYQVSADGEPALPAIFEEWCRIP